MNKFFDTLCKSYWYKSFWPLAVLSEIPSYILTVLKERNILLLYTLVLYLCMTVIQVFLQTICKLLFACGTVKSRTVTVDDILCCCRSINIPSCTCSLSYSDIFSQSYFNGSQFRTEVTKSREVLKLLMFVSKVANQCLIVWSVLADHQNNE